ncbi:uncharacterized protein TNIN_381331 [Trichonephila inaurata madagascariensis]|uniref:Uncharacterized protein n=1 Tax=Trichonephila inaurata madagascariensis TaxID=2747483 RepID=A0A8X7CCQ8_9ARAC|nr:uncharacterized protein TNIN_381331 [Trichonephila inaurata madagascariensis]
MPAPHGTAFPKLKSIFSSRQKYLTCYEWPDQNDIHIPFLCVAESFSMGTCFGCIKKTSMRKPTSRRKFFRVGNAKEFSLLLLFSFVYVLEGKFISCDLPLFILKGALHHLKNMKSTAYFCYGPLLNRENSFADTCSNTGSQKWDQLSTGATPGSSVDLEWENEIGFNSSSNFGATEELQWTVLTENTNNSYRSSPLSNSNGLEWDGDFTSVDVAEIVTETQRLTSELDDNVIQDSTNNTIRDIENNY